MEPYTIHFPVNFTEHGDETADAISKHIQEFAALAEYASDNAWAFKVDGEEI
jgi:meiotically up-regulated gene 157 (Mug157) protein